MWISSYSIDTGIEKLEVLFFMVKQTSIRDIYFIIALPFGCMIILSFSPQAIFHYSCFDHTGHYTCVLVASDTCVLIASVTSRTYIEIKPTSTFMVCTRELKWTRLKKDQGCIKYSYSQCFHTCACNPNCIASLFNNLITIIQQMAIININYSLYQVHVYRQIFSLSFFLLLFSLRLSDFTEFSYSFFSANL